MTTVVSSPPSRAAWIETPSDLNCAFSCASPPSRAAWIETSTWCSETPGRRASPPSRAAWIETYVLVHLAEQPAVAALAGGVD